VVLPQLRRVRWAVRATLGLGVAASVAANVLHAQDNPISQAIAAWPPLALLLTVELISRVPVHRRALAVARWAATATIAGIAAWVSYWHMAGVAARYGETGASAYLLPLSVDGLIVVASICLVELGGRIATLEAERTGVALAAGPPASEPAQAAPKPARPAATPDPAEPAATPKPAEPAATPEPAAARSKPTAVPGLVPAPRRAAPPRAPKNAKPRSRRTPAETVALAARIRADRPALTDAELAAELGISVSRWRTIRREAAQAQDLRLAA
jgi:hypothetical protein